METKEIINKGWELISEYRRKHNGDYPSFVLVHPKLIRFLIEGDSEWISVYQRPFYAYQRGRFFGVEVVESISIASDEILIGITPLKPIEE